MREREKALLHASGLLICVGELRAQADAFPRVLALREIQFRVVTLSFCRLMELREKGVRIKRKIKRKDVY